MSNRTYFVRHTLKLGTDEETLKKLWETCTIAIHFPARNGVLGEYDNDSLELETYTGAALGGMRVLKELADRGGYVAADYTGYGRLIGQVLPNSKIKLMKAKWRGGSKFGSLRPKGYPAVLKTLKLSNVMELKPEQQLAVFAGVPPQITISRWPKARSVIRDRVEGILPIRDWRTLSPQQQEILCSEFMRTPEGERLGLPQLAHLLLPVGSTLKDIDIAGIDVNGERIYAQVTHRTEFDSKMEHKLEALKKYKDGQSIMFCDCHEPHLRNDVWLCPISEVFTLFLETPLGNHWIDFAFE